MNVIQFSDFVSYIVAKKIFAHRCLIIASIRSSEKFLSLYEEIIDAQRFSFYIILPNYVRSISFCWDKHRDISQTWFQVSLKVHCCKKHVCERKILFGQPNISILHEPHKIPIQYYDRKYEFLSIYAKLKVTKLYIQCAKIYKIQRRRNIKSLLIRQYNV